MHSQQLQKNTTKNNKNNKYSSNRSQQQQHQQQNKNNWREKDKNLKKRGAIRVRMFKELVILNVILPIIVRRPFKTELKRMNSRKEGARYVYTDSFILYVAKIQIICDLPYRQLEGFIAEWFENNGIKIPCYTTLFRRIHKLNLEIKPPKKPKKIPIPIYNLNFNPSKNKPEEIIKCIIKGISLAIDSTAFEIKGTFNYLPHKHGIRKKREFVKLHAIIDIGTRQIIAISITPGSSHDHDHFRSLLEQVVKRYRNQIKNIYGDAAYSSVINILYCEGKKIQASLRTKSNYTTKSHGTESRKGLVTAQRNWYDDWCSAIRYGDRSLVESVFSSVKRQFGEKLRARKLKYAEQEIRLKVFLYNECIVA
jgi:transposase